MSGPLFKRMDCDVEYMISAIDQGTIGLPDIQRPFVWPPTKVRDLFDSMFRGYPIGYLLLWATSDEENSRQIGICKHGNEIPSTLIIDGQQRLTSLYAVMKGRPVLDKDFKERQIIIAFCPSTGEFEVSTVAHQKSSEWIGNISEIYVSSESAYQLTKGFIEKISNHKEVSKEEEEKIAGNIQRLLQLKKYPFSALEINSKTDEEDVAEIFVRVNSQGQNLNQTDFILTLMSVFWGEGKKRLEEFCEESRKPSINTTPYNHYIKPDPEQLLRVSIGYGFRRARLKYVYLILQGKDLDTGCFSDTRRNEQFVRLKYAQELVLDLQNWHDFLKVPLRAGYRSANMITSETALLYSYVFYLIGKYDFQIDDYTLRDLIAKWFFMSSLTGRYSSSAESRMEQDLADLRPIQNAGQFVSKLESIIKSELTNDFWHITLPTNLSTSAARSPSWYAYCAALNLLGAHVLFSKMKIDDLLDPVTNAKKSSLERHHLFPKKYLETIGITDDRDRNQIANYALVEWKDNIDILDDSPDTYLSDYLSRFTDVEKDTMYEWHALPNNWEKMDYYSFLEKRRKLMAEVIKKGFHMI